MSKNSKKLIRKKNKDSNKTDLYSDLIKLFKNSPFIKFSLSELQHKTKTNTINLNIILKKLTQKKIIKKDDKQKFCWIYHMPKSHTQNNIKLKGQVDHVSCNFAYIILDKKKDIKIYDRDLNGAFHGDLVQIKSRNHKFYVSDIIKRNKKQFIAIIKKNNQGLIAKLDGRRYHYDIELVHSKNYNAKENDRVLIKIVKWPGINNLGKGEIIEIFGKVGNHNSEIDAILYNYDLSIDFPKSINNQLQKFEEFHNHLIKNATERKDFRKINTFTIDPDDAKDYDDALSVEFLSNGQKKIGVHISDVTAYVKEDTEIDKEALKRGNSTYLVDRVIPMIPELLSNNICSLLPNRDRLTFSIEFLFDKNNKILKFKIFEGIINSKYRFTYKEAQEIINNKKGKFYTELNELMNLSKILKKQRIYNGSIDFISQEFKIKLDDHHEILEIKKKTIYDTNNLIEEFMLLANKYAAEYIHKKIKEKKQNFIYRIHSNPDQEKLSELRKFLKTLGFNLVLGNQNINKSLKKILNKLKMNPLESTINKYIIKTMSKAIYSPYQNYHFGLAFKYYTHFTSPIRRYSDLLSHRFMKKYLEIEPSKSLDIEYLEKICNHITNREKNSTDAERASIKFKQIEFLKNKLGHQFKALVTYISEKSLFAEILENGCEGIIYFSEIKGDFYLHDKEKFRIKGKKSNKIIKIGDFIDIVIKSIDIEKKAIEFSLI